MASASRRGSDESKTRGLILDAAERLMLAEGYAAMTARRVAAEADVNPGLLHYYFGPMDELYLALFRRRAELMLAREKEALAAEQPLWALWDAIRDQAATTLNLEFLALGNHRKAVRDEIRKYSAKFRRQQLRGVRTAFERRGVDQDVWPPVGLVLLIDGMSRYLLTERAYALQVGHAETIAMIERWLREVEGERRARPAPRLG